MKATAIIVMCIYAAMMYGVIHDQITARICGEYFTIGHPRVIQSKSPSLLALYWGTAATWWVGLFLGIGLAIVARRGKRFPKLLPADLIFPILKLLGWMSLCAIIGGICGFITVRTGLVPISEWMARRIPQPKHTAFMIVGGAHLASYASGFIGGVVIWVIMWRRRRNAAKSLDAKDQ